VCHPEEARAAAPSLGLLNGMGFLGRWGSFEQVVTLSRRFALITFDVGEGRVPGLALDAAALLLGHLWVGSLATEGLRSRVASDRRG
jgi:hypothetical protein